MSNRRHFAVILLAVMLGAGYALGTRMLFNAEGGGGARPFSWGSAFTVMSFSFMFLMPFGLGVLTGYFGPTDGTPARRVLRRIFWPWVSSLVFLGLCLLSGWEGLICVILGLPILFGVSSLGGLSGGFLRDRGDARTRTYCLAGFVLLPFIAAPLENLRERSNEISTVHTSIVIQASPAEVWRQIRSVPRITEAEHGFSYTHLLGFPRPVEALLEGEGIGAVRYARFERGVLFIEKITEWKEGERLSFSIVADTKSIPATTFDEHVTIGGPYFDVLHGTYWLEVRGPREVVLHLTSDQRLATGFNFYAHLWTEGLMRDLQDYILVIVKKRCEAAPR